MRSWFRRHWRILVPYMLVIGVGVAALAGFQHESDKRTAAIEQEAERRVESAQGEAHQRCLDRQTDRNVLRQAVTASFQGNASFDPRKVDGFFQLDPAEQHFWLALAQPSSQTDPSTRRDQLLAQLPPIDC